MKAAQTGTWLADRVAQAIEQQDRGETVPYAELCRDYPELTDTVRHLVSRRDFVASWMRAGSVDPASGQVLVDRYRLEECIGAGAMGAVYRAADLSLDRKVAVKILHLHPMRSDEAQKRFLREAEALASLRHHHVVPVFDRGVTESGLHYLVMELLHGCPLSQVLAAVEDRVAESGWVGVDQLVDDLLETPADRRGESYVERCVRWTAELASALAAAHAAGIVHRDVKPSNVFITDDGRARLVDFGVAAREADETLTAGDQWVGTPQYMAPEHVAGSPPHPQLDVYSLSATLYHMLAGHAPYRGTTTSVLRAIESEEPEAIGRVHPGLPRDLQAIIECGMARDLDRRYWTAAALEGDLRAFAADRPIQARRLGIAARVWRQVRQSLLLRIAAIVVVAAGLAVAGILAVQKAEERRDAAHLELFAEFPPTLTLGRGRVEEDEAARAAQLAALDRAVELRPAHQMTRCLRGAYRFDQGDFVGAAEDFGALADQIDTAYARALAGRYRQVGADGELDLSALPQPADQDRLLAAFHAMRQRDFAGAAELLPESVEDLAEREYRLVALWGLGATTGQRELIKSLRDPAREVAGAYGRETTRTLHLAATALLTAEQYEKALEPLEKLAAWVPRDYNVLNDLAIAYHRTGASLEAEAVARRATDLRPEGMNGKALSTLAKALARQERFDEAEAVVAGIPSDGRDGWRHFETGGFVAFERALTSFASDPDEAGRHAADALAEYETAASLRRLDSTVLMNVEVCRAIQDRALGRLCRAILALLEVDRRNPELLHSLSQHLPLETEPELGEQLRRFFAGEAAAAARN